MSLPRVIPCVWFDDAASEAAGFYARVFPGSRVLATTRYPTSFDNPGGKPRGSVLTVELDLAGLRLTLLNGGPYFRPDPSISFFVHADTPAEADGLFAALADGGEILMPLDAWPWSERYGWVQDRFGVSWQIAVGRRAPGGARIVPSLLFNGGVAGRALEALETWARLLPGGRVEDVEHFGEGEGPVGWLKQGRLTGSGLELLATDAEGDHAFSFGEGISLQVMCADQAEVDRLWDAFGEGGEASQCGWVRDRFGVCWQVVPEAMTRWMDEGDPVARDRAFAAMLEMGKLDVGVLEAAFAGTERAS